MRTALGRAAAAGLAIQGATHSYSGVTVLREVDLALRSGEIHALVGENGSGKSTMIRILTGALRPVGGRITLDGEEVTFSSPVEAQSHGIGVVHQEYQLFPDLSVAECVFGVGQAPPRHRWLRTVDRPRVERAVEELFADLGIPVAPRALTGSLNAAERKFVEIARAMAIQPRFLILDEATASFEPSAAKAVLDLLSRLAARGVGICFVSHRLDEVLTLADRITVLRDGRRVALLKRDEVGARGLIELIVGEQRQLEPARPRGPGEGGARGPGRVVLRLPGLEPGAGGGPLELRSGEILGLTGVVGSGASALVRGVGGADPLVRPIEVNGKRVRIGSPRDAAGLGIGFIPEDRKGSGVIGDQSVAINMALPALERVCRGGIVRRRKLEALGERYRKRLDIRLSSLNAPVATLSGGNQQKVMLARWLSSGVKLISIDEPTHGVDVGGRAQIHRLLREFVAEDRAILLASTDVDEVLEICDRIGVFRHGSLSAFVTPEELRARGDPEHELMQLIGGSAEAAG